MTTEVSTKIRFVRYNSGLGGEIPAWDTAKLIPRGAIFEVSAAGRPSLLRYLHGTPAMQSYFTVVEDEGYVLDYLKHCQPCHVFFESDDQLRRHLDLHEKAAANAPEVQELNRLEREQEADRLLVEEAKARGTARKAKRDELAAAIKQRGIEARIVDPNVVDDDDEE